MMVDVRAIAVTSDHGQSISGDGKSVTLHPGDLVTVGAFLSHMEDAGPFGINGLTSFSVSFRTRNEMFDTPYDGRSSPAWSTPWPNPSPTDTVLNGVSYTAGGLQGLPPAFKVVSPCIVRDLHPFSDPNDTDVDLDSIGALQYVPPFETGFGVGSQEFLMATGTFQAQTLPLASRPLGWSAEINTLFTTSSGAFGGLFISAFDTPNPSEMNDLTLNIAKASNIGTPVVVHVVPANPEPMTALAAGTALAGLALWSSRRRCTRCRTWARATTRR